MHLTWLPGDPVVQLNFPNPLNVSVQVGDVAYFSNPTPVGQAHPWTATTTPHLSNPKSGIIMIGEIIQIIPWNGTVSSIICNMPQLLFNQYFADIVEGGCPWNPPICSGDCDRIDPMVGLYNGMVDAYTYTFTPTQIQMPNFFVPDWPTVGSWDPGYLAFKFFFDNPTFHVDDYKFHTLFDLQNSNLSIISQYCQVVSSHPFYNPLWLNYYRRVVNIHVRPFTTIANPNPPNILTQHSTANSAINELMIEYPSLGFSLGMTLSQVQTICFANSMRVHVSTNPVNGSCVENPIVLPCVQGSFIMFSKDNKVNMSDMLGYYASVELRNNSKTDAELFNVGTTFFESSK